MPTPEQITGKEDQVHMGMGSLPREGLGYRGGLGT